MMISLFLIVVWIAAMVAGYLLDRGNPESKIGLKYEIIIGLAFSIILLTVTVLIYYPVLEWWVYYWVGSSGFVFGYSIKTYSIFKNILQMEETTIAEHYKKSDRYHSVTDLILGVLFGVVVFSYVLFQYENHSLVMMGISIFVYSIVGLLGAVAFRLFHIQKSRSGNIGHRLLLGLFLYLAFVSIVYLSFLDLIYHHGSITSHILWSIGAIIGLVFGFRLNLDY